MADAADQWAAFRPAPDQSAVLGDDPWRAFRISPQPDKASPGLLGYARDVATQGGYGVQRGLANFVGLPWRAADWAIETITGGCGLPDLETMPGWRSVLAEREAETAAGRFAGRSGEAIGSSVVPMAGLATKAGLVAVPAVRQAPSGLQRVGGQIVDAYRANPFATAALDVASATTSGIAQQAAQEAGLGPAGQAMAGMLGGMVPGVAQAYRAPANGRIGTETGETMARQRYNEAVADAAAHQNLEVRPFGPSFNQGPVASVGKQLTETALIGAPLRNNLDETFQDTAAAAQALAARISPTATAESAGSAAQRGLERAATARMQDLEPPVLTGMGLPVTAQVPRPQVMSQGAAQAAQAAAPIRQQIGANTAQTTRGATVPAVRPLSQSLTTRTTPEMLDDQQLARLIRAPADETSFATRQEALYERAWRMLPDLMRSNSTVNPNMVAAVNTRQAMRQIDDYIANQIGGQSTIGGALAERLRSAQAANFPLADLRAIRTEVGRQMRGGVGMPTENTLNRSQLRQLYGALSRDIETGIETLANRAAIEAQRLGTQQAVQTARRAAGALHAMRTADRYTRAGMERIDRVLTVVAAQSPEAAARRLIQGALDGTKGNVRMFRAAMNSLRPEELAEFGSLLVREMGRPLPSARGIVAEVGFSPSSFVTRWNAMSPEARALVFTAEHGRALDDLFRVAHRLANVEALTNSSRTATNAINVTGATTSVAAALQGDILTPLAIGGTGLAASVLMSRPEYVRWMIRYMHLRSAVRDGSDRAVAPLLRHVSGLERMAYRNPALVPVYADVVPEVESLRNDHRSQPTQ
ncbi:MAG: hypothetical protein E6Q97_26905 [Desulfurellales bacterium]|nr:MAG: hypothetical protein E6Q97_26905 [Desulfurellales bacterium]